MNESLDVEGWDAVIKLVILANAVLGINTKIDDVRREPMSHLTPADVAAARAEGTALKYIALAERPR